MVDVCRLDLYDFSRGRSLLSSTTRLKMGNDINCKSNLNGINPNITRDALAEIVPISERVGHINLVKHTGAICHQLPCQQWIQLSMS